jgi:hypothetical protein
MKEIKLTDEDVAVMLEDIEERLKRFQRLGMGIAAIITCQDGWSDWVDLEIQAVQRAIEVMKNQE